MGTPKTRREFEIWKVCDQMVAEGIPGIRVTGEAIRERLFKAGFSKGSPNEIYKYRKCWREARGVQEEDLNLSLPLMNQNYPSKQVTLNDPLVRAVEAVRTEIQKEVSFEIENIKKSMGEEVLAAKTAREGAELALKRLMEVNQSLSDENEKLKLDCQNLQAILLEEKQLRMAKEERLKVLEEAWLKLEENSTEVIKELKKSLEIKLELALQKNQELLDNQNSLDEVNNSLKREIINYLKYHQSA